VLNYSRMEMLVREKHSCLLDPFVSYVKMKCCEYTPWYRIYNFETYEWTNKLECYNALVWKGLPRI